MDPNSVRGYGVTSRHARILYNLSVDCDCKIADLDKSCVGPNYTFDVPGVGRSYIDHCMVSSQLLPFVNHCEVIPEDIHNNSDHLPLKIKVLLPKLKYSSSYEMRPRVQKFAWNKLDDSSIRQGYTHLLGVHLQRLLAETTLTNSLPQSPRDVDTFLDSIIDIILNVTRGTVPQVNFDAKIKQNWSSDLKLLNKNQLHARKRWIQEGRPRDEQSKVWLEYKQAKRQYHTTRKQAEFDYNLRCIDDFTKAEQMDQRYFWYLVNKSRKPNTTKRMQPTRDTEGNLLYDPTSITKSWRDYYADLYTPKSEPWYDDSHHQHVVDTLSSLQMTYLCKDDDMVTFTENDVKLKCDKLKRRKAAGVDGVTGENLLYDGPLLHSASNPFQQYDQP